MSEKHKQTAVQPALSFLISKPARREIAGRYDPQTQTWSDRAYAGVSDKKHNEGM